MRFRSRSPFGRVVVFPDLRIDAVRGCAAIERGPFVYCFESLEAESEPLDGLGIDVSKGDLLEHNTQVAGEAVVELSCPARRVTTGDGNSWPYHEQEREGGARSEEVRLKAIPYYAWSNRGPSYMRVWPLPSAHRRSAVGPRQPNQPPADGHATPSGDGAIKSSRMATSFAGDRVGGCLDDARLRNYRLQGKGFPGTFRGNASLPRRRRGPRAFLCANLARCANSHG